MKVLVMLVTYDITALRKYAPEAQQTTAINGKPQLQSEYNDNKNPKYHTLTIHSERKVPCNRNPLCTGWWECKNVR